MRIRDIPNKIAGVVLGFTLLLVIGAGSTTITQAQYRNDDQGRRGRNWDGYPNLGGSAQLRQTALNAGYNEGTKEGRNDRARGRHARFQDFSTYQRATKDYSSRLGDREIYRRYFRAAFESGYNTELGVDVRNNNNRDRYGDRDRDQNRRGRNWERYGNYGGSNELRQTALNAGYNEGIKEGRDARRRGRNSNFRNLNAYQNAAEDYSSGLGDRETYRRYYREGFENGYGDGYNGS